MSSKFRFVCALAVCGITPALAVETKTWQQSSMADFENGTLTRLSLSSDGKLTVAPLRKELFDPSVTFLWAIARDSKGTVYAGGGGIGSRAKLVAIDGQGKASFKVELEGIAVQAIAIDRNDRVYAATSPDGKVYRIDASGKAEVFYDPKTKYIWSLAFGPQGDLYVATGDQGEIHKVTPAGAGSVFFRSEEAHARSLVVDAQGDLIVGTEPSGLILRISAAGRGFVLYQAPKREITTVALAPDGTIYAAGAGSKPPALPATAPRSTASSSPGSAAAAPSPAAAPSLPPPSAGPSAVAGGSEVYRIQPDGFARKVWSHPQDVAYALAFDAQGRVLIGTGNDGVVYRLESAPKYTRLLDLGSLQVTALCSGPNGKIYAATGNIGKVFSIGPELETSGTIESDLLDAGAFSYWGRLSTEPDPAAGLVFETRSGNQNRAQNNWSPWAKLASGRVESPPARFLEYRATLTGPAELSESDIAYQMKNVAPVVELVEVTPANYKFPDPSVATTPVVAPLSLPPLGKRPSGAEAIAAQDSGSSPALTWSKGRIGARWLASDDNGDALLFKIEIRGVNEQGWKPVRDKVRERYLSWDSTAFPDGKYVVRVTATDAPSNPPGQVLSASQESDPFLIDNTAPEISALSGAIAGSKIEARFHAADALSVLGQAEYSINGGDWLVVEPTTRLTDSTSHDYVWSVDRAQGETTIAVRVSDEYYNQAVAKVVVK